MVLSTVFPVSSLLLKFAYGIYNYVNFLKTMQKNW